MTKAKKIKQKLKGDGRQIADLEKGLHNRKRAHAAVKRSPVRKIVNLLGSREQQEVAWLTAITNCEDHAARVPITQVTGAVPVDLYRLSTVQVGSTNANGYCFVGTYADAWVGNLQNGVAQLHANGATSYFGFSTANSFVGSASPASGAAYGAAGINGLLVPDCSSDFVSGAGTGTEYIQVANRTSLRMTLPPGAAADSRFVGYVYAFFTLDPERNPLTGLTPDALEAESLKQGSMIKLAKYRITGSGLFVAEEDAMRMEQSVAVSDCGGYGELHLHSVPLTKGAYEWERIGDDALGTTVTSYTDKMFVVVAPAGTGIQVRHTALWQTERYASALVRRPIPGGAVHATIEGMQSAASAIMNAFIPGMTPHPNVAGAAVVQQAAQQPGFVSQLINGMGGIDNIFRKGSEIVQFIKNFLGVNGGDLVSAVQGLYGWINSTQSSGSNWLPGLPPRPTPGTVEVLPEEGISGLIEGAEEGLVDLAPEVIGLLA